MDETFWAFWAIWAVCHTFTAQNAQSAGLSFFINFYQIISNTVITKKSVELSELFEPIELLSTKSSISSLPLFQLSSSL